MIVNFYSACISRDCNSSTHDLEQYTLEQFDRCQTFFVEIPLSRDVSWFKSACLLHDSTRALFQVCQTK